MNHRIAFYARPFPGIQSWYDMVDASAERGMTSLEAFTNMDLAEPDVEEAKKLRAYAEAKGVRICCLSCFCRMTLENTEEQVQRMMAFVDVAAALGSPYFHHTVVSAYTTPDPLLENWDAVFENAVNAVRRIYDYGQSKGVRLIYEDQGYMVNGVENYGKFLEALDRDVGVLLDIGNNYNVDEELDGFLEKYLSRICHVHVKDVTYSQEVVPGWIHTLNHHSFWCVPMGQGIIDHRKYISRLEEAGYTGVYSLEFGADSDESPLIDDAIATLSGWLR